MKCPFSPAVALSLLHKITPRIFGLLIAAASLFSLLAAFTAQYGFNLLPCHLCLLQRIPFAINILLGIATFFVATRRSTFIVLMGIVFWANSALALFHSGVERKWWIWDSGCTTPQLNGTMDEIIERIKATSVVRCDEIPWSLFGLSMANYNVLFCFGLGAACFGYLLLCRMCTGRQS